MLYLFFSERNRLSCFTIKNMFKYYRTISISIHFTVFIMDGRTARPYENSRTFRAN